MEREEAGQPAIKEITELLLRKRSEHNEGCLSSLQEIALHQQDLGGINKLLAKYCPELEIVLLQNNLIRRIENLNKLKKLRYLNLALNNITKIEGLRELEFLDKLDLTANFVDDILSVESLARNTHLRELHLIGNPCTNYRNSRLFIVSVLPHLKNLDGTEVTPTERLQAAQCASESRAMVVADQAEYQRQVSAYRTRHQRQHQQAAAAVRAADPRLMGAASETPTLLPQPTPPAAPPGPQSDAAAPSEAGATPTAAPPPRDAAAPDCASPLPDRTPASAAVPNVTAPPVAPTPAGASASTPAPAAAAPPGGPGSEGYIYLPEERVTAHEELHAMRTREDPETAEKKRRQAEEAARSKAYRKRLVDDEGRILQKNEGDWKYTFFEEDPPGTLGIDVAISRFLDTSLIAIDTHPFHITLTIRDRVLQLRLPMEVYPDRSSASRSSATGHLLVVMPKVDPHQIWFKTRDQIAQEKEAAKPKLVASYADAEFSNDALGSAHLRRRPPQGPAAGSPAAPPPSQPGADLKGAVDLGSIVAEGKKRAPGAPKDLEPPPPGMEDLPPLE
ncbi:putative Protein tilB [Paratrimastix pyriformis]|uniref:Dynein axonemal assembly factor 11-like CS domain-containing protein n=1 Tax=Paratrimastix pyriformis TaxID=342808 RepID=A0ABQ8USM4_9EUKA|nr:putative Protein tilB [Paratrimastix pyriformis]